MSCHRYKQQYTRLYLNVLGGWASLYSKSFEFTGGKQKFMFDYIKWTDEEILQVQGLTNISTQ